MSASPREVARLAPAKLNLFLEVHGRRPDGFHEVETLLVALDRGDRVTVRSAAEPAGSEGPRVALHLSGPAATPDVPRGPTNLAARAVQGVLALASGPPRSLEIELEKRIPSQAGLGGGSSDAVAAALASAALVGIADARLLPLVAALGSDCAFFLEARATGLARCRGRGELVTTLAPAPPCAFAVLVPPERCPTAAVYARVRVPASDARRTAFDPEAIARGVEEVRDLLFNRLEEAALAAVPALGAWRAGLDASGARHFRLSGSGSAFFGMFPDETKAAAALSELELRLRRRDLAARDGFVARPLGVGQARLESK